MNDFQIIIPARYRSTRFPAKVLARLSGRSVLEWCYRAAKRSGLGPVTIAADDERVASAARGFGAEVFMTPRTCASGTDRVYLACQKGRSSFIINYQADQPLLSPATLRRVANLIKHKTQADITTAFIPLNDARRIADPDVVKVAVAADGRCLYFSRAPIPYHRNGNKKAPFHEHLGLYVFRRPALERFISLKPTSLERLESLEQLRALENGMTLYAAEVNDLPAAIDTPKDLQRAEDLLKALGLKSG